MGQLAHEFALRSAVAFAERVQRIQFPEIMCRAVAEGRWIESRKELLLRIALGARAGDIVRRVTLEVFAMLAMGALTGLALGIASERYIATLLFAVKATDPSMLILPAVMIAPTAILAALPPVLRALRIDPAALLRAE